MTTKTETKRKTPDTTAGPWCYRYRYGRFWVEGGDGRLRYLVAEVSHCQTGSYGDESRGDEFVVREARRIAEANARLIAASPALLREAEWLLAKIEGGGEAATLEQLANGLERLRAAVRRARTGE